MLGYTDPSSIWGHFPLGCYSSWVPADPVYLAVLGGKGPVGPTGDDSPKKLLGVIFYWLNKNTGYLLFLCSLLTELHWRLWMCHCLRFLFGLLLCLRLGRIGRRIRLFLLFGRMLVLGDGRV